MDDESRIMMLVEEVLDSDRTPEEACRDHPELIPQVRAWLDRFRNVEAEIGAAFPPRSGSERAFLRNKARTLPDIPGYAVEQMIDTGGMGVVYKARHLKLNRPVAIKMLLAGGYAGPREIERFKREAEAVAALRHHNIVQIYDFGEHDGIPYFTMEFMEGGSLAQALGGVPQPAVKAAELALTLAHAVDYAHNSGVVHRDLKPANILLTTDETLKITDFGLARRAASHDDATLTVAGAHVGTPSYMS